MYILNESKVKRCKDSMKCDQNNRLLQTAQIQMRRLIKVYSSLMNFQSQVKSNNNMILYFSLPQAIIIGFCKQHSSRWDGSYELSHLDLRCLTVSLSTLRKNFFSSNSLLKNSYQRRLQIPPTKPLFLNLVYFNRYHVYIEWKQSKKMQR